MKKLLTLLLILLAAATFAFADESDDSDDFDDIFSSEAQDIVVEESTPVIPAASSGPAASLINFTGHFEADVGLSAIIIDKPDFGGYLDLKNLLYLNVKPSPVFSLHGALETSLKNAFSLNLNYLYFDYMIFNKIFISAGKKEIKWGYTRLFENCNVMSDTNSYLNAEFRLPWSSGTATMVASYNYAKLTTSPSYKDISYAASLEQTIGHTSLNLFGKIYGHSERINEVHKNPLAGLEAKRTFWGYDAYLQAYTSIADFKQLNKKEGYQTLTATGGFYKLWDSFEPNLGINIEYQYIWKPAATDDYEHNHLIFLQGGIKRIGKKKNMKGALEWQHNFNTSAGLVKAAFIVDGLFPYASWKNGIEVDYSKSAKPKFTLGTTISISLDY